MKKDSEESLARFYEACRHVPPPSPRRQARTPAWAWLGYVALGPAAALAMVAIVDRTPTPPVPSSPSQWFARTPAREKGWVESKPDRRRTQRKPQRWNA